MATWTELMPAIIIASRAPQKEAREFAVGQLMLLAEIVDRHIANLDALEKALPAPTPETAGIIPAMPHVVPAEPHVVPAPEEEAAS